MKMLAVRTTIRGWQWVVRRDKKNNAVVTTPYKDHGLGTEDLEYFRGKFPNQEFMAREMLS